MVVVVPPEVRAAAVRFTGLKTTRKKIRNVGKKRSATTITFRLNQPAPLMLVFRGPGPSCKVAGRLNVLGLAGRNEVRFDGTIRKHRLRPGTYLIVTRLRSSREPLGQTHLTIVDPQAPSAPRVLPDCNDSTPFQLAFPHSSLAPLVGSFTPTPDGDAGAEPKPVTAANGDDDKTVLEAQTPPAAGLPELVPIENEDAPGVLALLLVVLLVGSLLLFLVALATNAFGRQPRS